MRLIGTFKDQKLALRFSQFLNQKNISNHLELKANTDWGSEQYGNAEAILWVIDEDKFTEAYQFFEKFNQDPLHDEFKIKEAYPQKSLNKDPPPSSRTVAMGNDTGTITLYTLMLCVFIFMFGFLSRPHVTELPKNIPVTPFVTPSINKELMFDYPNAFLQIDRLIDTYGQQAVMHPQSLPPRGRQALQQAVNTPYWKGIYDQIVDRLSGAQKGWNFTAPMFERIRSGQIWRLFSPCLLHADLFHIFFNMYWLVFLGRQMERRLQAIRYILLMVIAGIFSNTCQYLMSGPNFIGFSGIICGMLVFIWFRQKAAPWEGYHLPNSIMYFVAAFVFGIAFLQLIFFTLEASGVYDIGIPIANTAHLSGGLMGYILNRIPFFSKN